MEEKDRTLTQEPYSYHLKIKDLPKGERPREKLIERGAEALSDAELLAILIHSGLKKITALDIANQILVKFKNFRELSRRTLSEITSFKGVGKARAVSVLASLEIGRRMQSIPDADDFRVRSPEDVAHRYMPRMRDLNQEKFYALMLNSSGKIIKEVEISRGTVNASLVHPREVFKAAVVELATSIVLVHNHPGGTAEPSREDREITKQLVEAGKFMDIPVQDHVIICGDSYISFVEKGWI